MSRVDSYYVDKIPKFQKLDAKQQHSEGDVLHLYDVKLNFQIIKLIF